MGSKIKNKKIRSLMMLLINEVEVIK